MTNLIPPLKLRNGAGGDYANGLCVMEAVAWMASEGATDAPQCACPVLAKFAIGLNDRLDDDNRQLLKPLILPLTGTRSPEHERQRANYLVMAVAARIVPQAFDKLSPEHAAKMRACKTLADVREVMADADADADADAAVAAAAVAAAGWAAAAGRAARQQILVQCIPILREAIMLGPNAADQWETYEPRAQALTEFLMGAV